MISLQEIVNFIKLPPRILCGLSLVGLALLSMPDAVLQFFNIQDFRAQYGALIGIVTIVSIVFFFVQLIPYITKIYTNFKQGHLLKNRLKFLSKEEKDILKNFTINKTQTFCLDSSNDVVVGLVAKRILLRHYGQFFTSFSMSHSIPDDLWKYITKKKINF